jgi:16S rRNA (guanine527-N7)-methyltransferase
MGIDLLTKYYPNLTAQQQELFEKAFTLYAEWNDQINVISRKDIDYFYERHVLHSLAITKVQPFKDGQHILDIGTGGGFPGIPLAIYYPNVQFTLVDSIAKKIKVVNEVAQALGLTNVKAVWGRVEEQTGPFDYAVTRAVAPAETLLYWLGIPEKPKGKMKPLKIKQSLLALKGGDLEEELQNIFWPWYEHPISRFYSEEFFETKKVIEFKFT